jgi:hypothetical protein
MDNLGESELIEDCTFEGNTRGLYVFGFPYGDMRGFTTVNACVFRDNGSPVVGIYCTSPRVGNCVFADNHGSSIVSASTSWAYVRKCTFVGNDLTGTVFYFGSVDPNAGNRCTVSYNIVAFNDCVDLVRGAVDDSEILRNCFYGNSCGDHPPSGVESEEYLIADPLFCDRDAGDYTLCANSPCLADNEPAGISMGAFWDAPGCDFCGSIVAPSSWGRIKALYRTTDTH